MPPYDKRPIAERFWSFVDRDGECWTWKGSTNGAKGYGRFYPTHGLRVYAHRFAYELANGNFDPQIEVLHSCDNPRCVNPSHLSLGSHTDNMRDMSRKGRHVGNRWAERTHCKNGHEFDASTPRRKDGSRACNSCKRESLQRRKARA
jgi:hypothetical protein